MRNKEIKKQMGKYKTNIGKVDLNTNVSTNVLNEIILNTLAKRQKLLKVTMIFKRNNI